MEQIDGNDSLVGDDLDEDEKYVGTRHYWKTGRLGTVYQTFIDANEIIEKSDLAEGSNNQEKEKILDARKTAFGPHFSFVPPWNKKPSNFLSFFISSSFLGDSPVLLVSKYGAFHTLYVVQS